MSTLTVGSACGQVRPPQRSCKMVVADDNINPDPFTTRPEIEGTFGVVTSTHWITTAVGMATLEKGGNAFDADVATALTLQVVEPHLNGPGGDVPIIVHDVKRGHTEAICGQGPAPDWVTIANYISVGPEMVPGTGLLAVCVPGTFEFCMLLLRDYGTLRLRDVLEPAIDRRLQHVAQPQCAVVAQQQHPGFKRAGDAGRQQPGAGHHVEPFAPVMRDRCACGRGALAADHLGAAALDVVNDDRTSPPGPFRCGSTTWSVNAVATPASKALPPFSRVAIPTAVAIQCVEVTTPKVPSISGRVVNGSGLILLIGATAPLGRWRT